jgi:hypothetical protein
MFSTIGNELLDTEAAALRLGIPGLVQYGWFGLSFLLMYIGLRLTEAGEKLEAPMNKIIQMITPAALVLSGIFGNLAADADPA